MGLGEPIKFDNVVQQIEANPVGIQVQDIELPERQGGDEFAVVTVEIDSLQVDDKMLDRMLVEMTVAADVWNPPGMGSRVEGPLMVLAKYHGVNAKKIEAEIKAQFGQEKAAQKPKKATTETGNYDKCSLRKRMASNAKGVKIPKGSGKCTREGGLCVAKMKGGKKE